MFILAAWMVQREPCSKVENVNRRIKAPSKLGFKRAVWTYLLVEQGPEHWQRDVEEQHPQHHLDLLDQTFLLVQRERRLAATLNRRSFTPRDLYRVLLLGPVQPVLPLGVVL